MFESNPNPNPRSSLKTRSSLLWVRKIPTEFQIYKQIWNLNWNTVKIVKVMAPDLYLRENTWVRAGQTKDTSEKILTSGTWGSFYELKNTLQSDFKYHKNCGSYDWFVTSYYSLTTNHISLQTLLRARVTKLVCRHIYFLGNYHLQRWVSFNIPESSCGDQLLCSWSVNSWAYWNCEQLISPSSEYMV